MQTVNAVAFGLKDYITDENIELLEGETIGEFIEDALTNVCYSLASVAKITEGKIDTDFLLSIVGSYILAGEQGELEEGTDSPAGMFDTTMVDAMENFEVDVQKMEEAKEEDGEPTDTTTT